MPDFQLAPLPSSIAIFQVFNRGARYSFSPVDLYETRKLSRQIQVWHAHLPWSSSLYRIWRFRFRSRDHVWFPSVHYAKSHAPHYIDRCFNGVGQGVNQKAPYLGVGCTNHTDAGALRCTNCASLQMPWVFLKGVEHNFRNESQVCTIYFAWCMKKILIYRAHSWRQQSRDNWSFADCKNLGQTVR